MNVLIAQIPSTFEIDIFGWGLLVVAFRKSWADGIFQVERDIGWLEGTNGSSPEDLGGDSKATH